MANTKTRYCPAAWRGPDVQFEWLIGQRSEYPVDLLIMYLGYSKHDAAHLTGKVGRNAQR